MKNRDNPRFCRRSQPEKADRHSTRRRPSRTKNITKQMIQQVMHLKQKEAASQLSIGVSTLKKKFVKLFDNERWPCTQSEREEMASMNEQIALDKSSIKFVLNTESQDEKHLNFDTESTLMSLFCGNSAPSTGNPPRKRKRSHSIETNVSSEPLSSVSSNSSKSDFPQTHRFTVFPQMLRPHPKIVVPTFVGSETLGWRLNSTQTPNTSHQRSSMPPPGYGFPIPSPLSSSRPPRSAPWVTNTTRISSASPRASPMTENSAQSSSEPMTHTYPLSL